MSRSTVIGALVSLIVAVLLCAPVQPALGQSVSITISASANPVQGLSMTVTVQGVADASHQLYVYVDQITRLHTRAGYTAPASVSAQGREAGVRPELLVARAEQVSPDQSFAPQRDRPGPAASRLFGSCRRRSALRCDRQRRAPRASTSAVPIAVRRDCGKCQPARSSEGRPPII